MRLWCIVLVMFVQLVAASVIASEAQADERPPIGMNLSSVNDYSPTMSFRNLAKQGRDWQTAPKQFVKDVDEHGFPTKLTGSAYTTMILGIITQVVRIR